MLAHGGAQIQTERTMEALIGIGVSVEPLAWWNDRQTGDVLHHIGALPPTLIDLAHAKHWKVASTILLTETCNRPAHQLLLRKLLIRSALHAPLPASVKSWVPWRWHGLCDKVIVGLHAERRILEELYGVSPPSVQVVPLGLTDTFLHAGPAERKEDPLICTGRIAPSKNSVELASLAQAARVPVLFVGKPADVRSEYWEQFGQLIDGQFVKHHPHVTEEKEMVALLQRARGYVLMSKFENWCLAAHEAAACGQPLLLPDQPWSRERFGNQASYWPKKGRGMAKAALQQFYELCPGLPPPKIELHSWPQVAEILKKIYEQMLGS
jgi:glycosyltransferase involved in cell wall biosynthesis